MIDANLLAQGRDALRARADALLNARFGPIIRREFALSALQEGLARGEIQRWLRHTDGIDANGSAIYRITARTQDGARSLLRAFDRARIEADFKLPRRNPHPAGLTIYVGSSLKIAARLREHLQRANRQTYALHLGRWCPAERHLLIVEVQAPDDGVRPEMLQDVEDALWDQSRPLFGRRGAR